MKGAQALKHRIPRGGVMHTVASNGVILDFTYAAQTPEEIEVVMAEIEKAAWAIIDELVERGEAV